MQTTFDIEAEFNEHFDKVAKNMADQIDREIVFEIFKQIKQAQHDSFDDAMTTVTPSKGQN